MEVDPSSFVSNIIIDESEKHNELKPQRRRLQDILLKAKTTLQESFEKSANEWPVIERFHRFSLNGDKQQVDIDTFTLSTNLLELQEKNKIVLETYIEVMTKMFQVYEILENKISELEDLQQGFIDLSFISEDDSEPAIKLLTSIDNYIQYKYDTCKIVEDYEQFRTLYNEWRCLRDVLIHGKLVSSHIKVCGICTNEKISVALIPCGHTYCQSCAAKQKNVCFICRTNVKDRLRIFLS
jgi:hypothetical protein